MTTDPFTEAARAEAESWIGMDLDDHDNFVSGAEWGREQALAQEPTDAEVMVAMAAYEGHPDRVSAWRAALTAAWSARAARRDEEKPHDGSPTTDCGRGPCCLGDGHDGDCRR